MSFNDIIWEPLPSLPSKPDLFGWPGGDSDSEDLNETVNSKVNVNNTKYAKDPSVSTSPGGVSSTSDCGDNYGVQHGSNNSSVVSKHPANTLHVTNWSSEAAGIRDNQHGHSLVKKIFRRPVTCHHCGEVMWGFASVAMICEVCNFLSHEKCVSQIVGLCSTIASTLVARPRSHCWTEPMNLKRKFCNICRKRMDDGSGVKCEICGYFCHVDCQDFVINDCKEGAMYSGDSMLALGKMEHHWREGNLARRGPRCLGCNKSCHGIATAECLTGFRCEWCGSRVHSACLRSVIGSEKGICDLGELRSILLPPNAVSLPRTNKVPIRNIIGVSSSVGVGAKGMTQDEWSDEESKDSFTERRSLKEYNEKEKAEEVAKVFDGNSGIRRRAYRCFVMSKQMTTQEAIQNSLHSFHIFGNTDDYYISEINEHDGTENPLDDRNNLKSQLKFNSKRPMLVLRSKELENDKIKGKLKIYPGDLVQYAQVTSRYKEIPINRETTAKEVLIMALKRFHCEEFVPNLNNLYLMEVCLDRKVVERLVANDERPWEIIQRLRRESVRALRLSRFYLRLHDNGDINNNDVGDNMGAISNSSTGESPTNTVTLFVGNLVENLNQNIYERTLLDKIGTANKWDNIEVIYYEYGCIVVSYKCIERAEACYEILKETIIKDRTVMVMILPKIIPSMIPDSVTPLLVLVNVKSGGCQGAQLISSFRRALNPHQVFNLEFGGPLPGLYCFRQIRRYRILVCGGDGTVGWALSCLDNTSQDAACHSPPIAVLPLGTGNDLARVLRWGSGYSTSCLGTADGGGGGCGGGAGVGAGARGGTSSRMGSGSSPISILRDVVHAEEVKLDRWTLVVKSDDPEKDEAKRALQLETNTLHGNEDSSLLIIMNNYCGIGLDADLALDFHLARSGNPEKFNSRIHNKTVYFWMGLRKMVCRNACKDLHRKLILEADGHQIDLPPIEGLIVLNIMSWGAGASPWGNSGSTEDSNGSRFKRPTHYDGLLEVLGVCGMLHIGQIFSGIRSGIRICQAGHLKITLKEDLPVQVDGEPFIQSPGQITVLKSALHAVMLRKSKRSSRQRIKESPSTPQGTRDHSNNATVSDTNNSLNTE